MNKKQLKLRKTGIGGSDAAKVLGVSPWGSAFTVYQDKKNLITDNKSSIAMELGNILEPWIKDKYIEKTGCNIEYQPKLVRHPVHNFMIGNIDAVSTANNLLVEFKTARNENEWGEEGTSDIPHYYLCQVMHYLCITGLPKSDVFVFFKDTEKFKLFHVERDGEIEKVIIEKEKYFWEENILKDICPEPTNFDEFKLLFTQSNGQSIEANYDTALFAGELEQIKEALKKLEAREEYIKKSMMEFMKENEGLYFDSKLLATWKSNWVNRFDIDNFKKEYPDLYNKFLLKTQQRRFLIK